jgi:TolB-like protein
VPQRSGRIPPTLAVLPFDNRSNQLEDAAFAACLTDDLAVALSLSPWVKVLAANAARTRGGEASVLPQLRWKLGVRYFLQGNVQRKGERLRLTAALLEANSGAILWTRLFDWSHSEISARQEDHVMELAGHVSGQVQRVETMRALQKTEDLDAWDAYLLATLLSVFQCPTRAGWEAAVASAQQAVDLDPSDGAAYATLAANQGQLLHHCGGNDPRLVEQITENIRKAQLLDPNNPAAMAEIAGGLIGLRKFADALPLAERAVAMSPRDDNARHMLGALLARMGRSDEAIVELDVADRLTPNGTWAYLSILNRSIAHVYAGRTDVAAQLAANLVPTLPGPELLLQCALCFAKLGRWDRSHDAMRQLREVEPEMSRELAEGLVRGLYCASAAVDRYVAFVRRAWNESLSGG